MPTSPRSKVLKMSNSDKETVAKVARRRALYTRKGEPSDEPGTPLDMVDQMVTTYKAGKEREKKMFGKKKPSK